MVKKKDISINDINTIKSIDVSSARKLIKEMNRKSIIADNGDVIKKIEVKTFMASGSCSIYDFEPYTYEQLVIDLNEIKKIQNKL